jgi:hypothetical protein
MAQHVEVFQLPYMFNMNNTVVIEHIGGDYLRADPKKETEADPAGKMGEWAQWKAHLHENGGVMQLENVKTGKYLRILDGKHVDVGGIGGKFTMFKVHRVSNGYCKLESVEFPGKFIAVDRNGVRIGPGGEFCRLGLFRTGKKEAFSAPYHFKEKKSSSS